MAKQAHSGPPSTRRGSVLLIVLVVVAMLTLGTAAYLELMQSEHEAVRFRGKSRQAQRLAESGVEYLKLLLAQPLIETQRRGGLNDNPALMLGVVIDDRPDDFSRGRCTIVAPALVAGMYAGVRYGLEDESAKLNVNVLLAPGVEAQAPARLMALPGMTPEIADAILDWLDVDDAPRPYGAERQYYAGLNPPYVPRNGPIGDLDELLPVRGMTPELLYGLDQNQNFVADVDESPRGALLEIDNADGSLNRGWSAYLTTCSVEGGRSVAGTPKLDLNGQNLQTLFQQLGTLVSQPEAKFIIALRQSGGPAQGQGGANQPPQNRGGPSPGAGSAPAATTQAFQAGPVVTGGGPQGAQGGSSNQGGGVVSLDSLTLDFTRPGTARINSLLDLVGASAQIPGVNNGPPSTVQSPWQADAASYRKLLAFYDAATTTGGARIAGRVNINAASRPVLFSIPTLPPAIVDQIITRREAEADWQQSDGRHAIWLLLQGIVTLEQMRELEPYVTARGDAYSGQAAGFFDAGGPVARAQFVLDRSGLTPRLRAWRELSGLGPGFSRLALGAADAAESTDMREPPL